jgi:hypothetical protein
MTAQERADRTAGDTAGEASTAPAMLRAYVNERGVSVPHGATAHDAVHAFDEREARALREGTRRLTDSRGLPIEASSPVHGGAIYRLLPVRAELPETGSAAVDGAAS